MQIILLERVPKLGQMGDVVKVTVYLKEGADWKAMNEEYRKHFNEPLPARTSLFRSGLANPEMMLEVEATAIHPI